MANDDTIMRKLAVLAKMRFILTKQLFSSVAIGKACVTENRQNLALSVPPSFGDFGSDSLQWELTAFSIAKNEAIL